MITRKEWGAKPLTAYNYKIEPAYRTGIAIHHSVTAEGRSRPEVESILRQIDDYQRSKGYGGIGYNIAVDYAGRIYAARGMNRMGVHVVDANSRNYGVVYIGNGDKRITDDAVVGIRKVVRLLQQNSDRKLRIYGHRDLYATACPGAEIYRLIKRGRIAVPHR